MLAGRTSALPAFRRTFATVAAGQHLKDWRYEHNQSRSHFARAYSSRHVVFDRWSHHLVCDREFGHSCRGVWIILDPASSSFGRARTGLGLLRMDRGRDGDCVVFRRSLAAGCLAALLPNRARDPEWEVTRERVGDARLCLSETSPKAERSEA